MTGKNFEYPEFKCPARPEYPAEIQDKEVLKYLLVHGITHMFMARGISALDDARRETREKQERETKRRNEELSAAAKELIKNEAIRQDKTSKKQMKSTGKR